MGAIKQATITTTSPFFSCSAECDGRKYVADVHYVNNQYVVYAYIDDEVMELIPSEDKSSAIAKAVGWVCEYAG